MPEFIIDSYEINFTRQAMNAAHQAFPREFAEWNLALFQKGKPVLPGVTVREIAPVGMTDSDKHSGVYADFEAQIAKLKCELGRQLDADTTIGTDSIAGADNSIPIFNGSPAPQTVDAGGEWHSFQHAGVRRLWSSRRNREFIAEGATYHCTITAFRPSDKLAPISDADAIAWLRANGHEAEAAKLEGDRFEPVGTVPVVGDQVWTASHGSGAVVGVKQYPRGPRIELDNETCHFVDRFTDDKDGTKRKDFRILKRRTGGN